MNLKQLEAFVQVAEGGSFSKAARELYLTQPTISAHISSLEKELNVRLFVRNTKEVSLSDNGKDRSTRRDSILIRLATRQEPALTASLLTPSAVRCW